MGVPGFPPEYIQQDASGHVVRVAVAFIVLELLLVALRFVSRSVSKTHSGLDDVLIVPALVFCLGICILAIIEAKIAGIGRHMDVLLVFNPTAVINWAKCGYAVEELYCAAVVFPKLSILAFYIRIFTMKPYRLAVYVISGILIANGIAGLITSLTSCRPFAARWDVTIPGAHCIDTLEYWRWISLANMATDVVMLGLPHPVIWRLQISKTQKYGLVLVFLTGSIGLIASVIRFSIFFNVKALSDGTYASANLAIWSLVEPGVYLIAACLPSLRPLILFLFERVFTMVDSKHTQRYGNSSLTGNARKHIPLRSMAKTGSKIEVVKAKNAGFSHLDGISGDNSSIMDVYRHEIRNAGAGGGGASEDVERSYDGSHDGTIVRQG